VSGINPFPDRPECIGGIGEWAYDLWRIGHPAPRILFKMLNRPACNERVYYPLKMLGERELTIDMLPG